MKTKTMNMTALLMAAVMTLSGVGTARGAETVPPVPVPVNDGRKVMDPPLEDGWRPEEVAAREHAERMAAAERARSQKKKRDRRNAVLAGVAVVAAVGVTVHIKLGKERSEKRRVSVGFYATGGN